MNRDYTGVRIDTNTHPWRITDGGKGFAYFSRIELAAETAEYRRWHQVYVRKANGKWEPVDWRTGQ